MGLRKYGLRLRDMFSLFLSCSIRSKLPESTRIVHPFSINIGDNVVFGENCEIFQNVSIGRRWKDVEEYIVIGNNVRICSGACVIGNVKIGDNVVVGANAVVLHDIPSGEHWVGIPAKKVIK